VGSEQGSTIPLEKNTIKMDEYGRPVVTKLNSAYLEEIAESVNGYYYELTPETNDVNAMLQRIQKMEGSVKGTKKIESVANKYVYFLVVAIMLITIDVLITVKTTKL
jgi:Ca-activated chloride channel family protein